MSQEFLLTEENFQSETRYGTVLVDFWADWCGPCKMQDPILKELADELPESELKICKVNVDVSPNITLNYNIQGIPALLFKKDGKVKKLVAGVHSKEAIKQILREF